MPPSSSSSPDVDLSRADLLSLGTVCASPGCGTRDFLPFRCSFCAGVFCLEHRRDHGGACGPASARVLVCPVCARAVKLPPSKGSERELTEEAAAAAFDAHARSKDCDPSNYDRVHSKARCPSPNCRERLGPSNKYECKGCGATTCLRHRHATDHGCAERAAAARAAAARSAGSRWNRLVGGAGGSRPPPTDASLARTVSGRLKALFVSCGAAPETGRNQQQQQGQRQGQQQQQQGQQQRVPPAAAAAAAAARRLAGNSSSNGSSGMKKSSTGK